MDARAAFRRADNENGAVFVKRIFRGFFQFFAAWAGLTLGLNSGLGSGLGSAAQAQVQEATGGTETIISAPGGGQYRVHTFTAGGTLMMACPLFRL